MKPCIILIIPPMGYDQNEYLTTKHTLEDHDCRVKTASTRGGTAAAHHPESHVIDESKPTTTRVDITVSEIDTLNHQGIFVIGGPGTLRHLDVHEVYEKLMAACNFEVCHGGIGKGCRILADAGVLENKSATGWNDDGKLPHIFQSAGCEYMHEDVVTSDHLITAKSHAAKKFADTIAQKTSWYY